MKTEEYIARQFERAKAINRKYGHPVVRYSIDLDEIVAWDFEQFEEIDQFLADDVLEDDYSEESFP